jgi:hypothetical protein
VAHVRPLLRAELRALPGPASRLTPVSSRATQFERARRVAYETSASEALMVALAPSGHGVDSAQAGYDELD